MKTNDTVHVILGDGIVGDSSQIGLLIAVVELRAREVDPGRVGSWDAECVDSNTSKLIDGAGVQERGIASLEDGTAVVTKKLAERPLVSNAIATN